MRRVVAWALSALLVAVLGGLGGGGWYFSDQVLPMAEPVEAGTETEVVGVDPVAGTITVAATEGDVTDLDTVGLVTPAGALVLEGPTERSAATATRHARLLHGSWPRSGEVATTSAAAYVGDPATTLGLPYDAIEVPSDLGRLPAWRVVPNRASTDTWVVIVHGRDSALEQGNRLLPTLRDLELPSLSVSVRNDPGAPPDPGGSGYDGDRGWEDLQAAIDHLRSVEDARRVVLVGYGHGASTVMSFLRRSTDHHRVSATVLISPLLSMRETLALHAQERGVPGFAIPPLLATTRWLCSLRAGLDLDELEHLDLLDQLPRTPMLITHGDADRLVPVEPSRALADARPDQVVYEEYAGAGHTREWNADPGRFSSDLHDFLATRVQDASP